MKVNIIPEIKCIGSPLPCYFPASCNRRYYPEAVIQFHQTVKKLGHCPYIRLITGIYRIQGCNILVSLYLRTVCPVFSSNAPLQEKSRKRGARNALNIPRPKQTLFILGKSAGIYYRSSINEGITFSYNKSRSAILPKLSPSITA